jgi:saccharopine dehydrogenase-like NADP-dependent oxidoreductase
MRFCVLGAGVIGSVVARDLAEAEETSQVVVCDLDGALAGRVAAELGPKGAAQCVDIRDVEHTAQVLSGAAVVVNCTYHTFNLAVMDAALRARVHYVDLGGLFHGTKKQLARDAEFREAGLTAILGCGGAPGVANILARYAVDRLDTVESISIRCAGWSAAPPATGLGAPYSPPTILDEFTLDAMVYDVEDALQGGWRAAPALSGEETVDFPEPIGRQVVYRNLHSETLTLPLSFRDKGLRFCDFKQAFDPDFAAKLKFLIALGLAREQPVLVKGAPVTPRDVLLALVSAQPTPPPGEVDDLDLVRAIVRGKVGGRAVKFVVDSEAPAYKRWNVSGGTLDTAVPAALCARWIATGKMARRGVLPPEQALAPEPFMEALARYGLRFRVTREEMAPTPCQSP